MGAIASLITSLTIVYSTVYSDADQRKHQSSASLAFVWGINRGRVNSPHKWPVTRKMFPFDDVIMNPGQYHKDGQYHWFQTGNIRSKALSDKGLSICLIAARNSLLSMILLKGSVKLLHSQQIQSDPVINNSHDRTNSRRYIWFGMHVRECIYYI